MHSLAMDYPANASIDKIELDVSTLKVGEGLFVKDIVLLKKCTTAIDEEEIVVNVTYAKVERKIKRTKSI